MEKETLDDIVRKEWREQEISGFKMSMREMERKLEKLDPAEDKSKVGTFFFFLKISRKISCFCYLFVLSATPETGGNGQGI